MQGHTSGGNAKRTGARLLATAAAIGLAVALAGCGQTADPAAQDAARATPELACAGHVYVTNSMSSGAEAHVPGSVSVIDMATNQVVANIPVGIGPINPTFDPTSEHLYVATVDSHEIAVIDVRTNQVASKITLGPTDRPSGLAFTPDGQRLVITLLGATLETPGHVQIITLASGERSAPILVGAQPERIALTPDGARAYVANIRGNSVSVIDLASQQVTHTIAMERAPFNVLMAPEGDRVYAANVRGNTIAVIDTATNTVSATITTEQGPNGMAYTPDHQNMFVTNVFANQVSEIRRSDNAVLRTGDVGDRPGHIRLSPDGRTAYIARPFGTTVSVLDTETLAITATIETGQSPTTVSVCGGP